MVFVVFALIIIIFLLTTKRVKFKINEKLILVSFFSVFTAAVLIVYSVIEMGKMPVVENKSTIYTVSNGITEDREFAFFYTENKCVVFKKNGEYYKKVYYAWDKSTFNLDKDLYLVYNRVEREKINNWWFFLPLQNIEEFYGLTQ